eukprot:CAMPEP_0198698732 /NCGR_PEP_ID=MMETSP1468-20131203/342637_1 /TAXON_ID=1461545 /ORGANISM="Mantoniella sp, Strain CCMP1436" /LENGTH=32 /DNA_ID= /DNA_START= /DNA_END= /DNA_ORIENTATION=
MGAWFTRTTVSCESMARPKVDSRSNPELPTMA